MGRAPGRPPKPPGEVLEVTTIRVSEDTRIFYSKLAQLFHSDEFTPLLMRTVLDRFRWEVESEAEDAWLRSLNEQLNRLIPAPDVLIGADGLDVVEAGRVVKQDAFTFGQDGVVGGVPRHRQCLGEAGDGPVLADQSDQGPPPGRPGPLGAGLSGAAGVLAPDMPAAGAPVAADRDEQGRRGPAQRLVRQPSGHRVPSPALAPTGPAPPVQPCQVIGDSAGLDRPVRLKVLADHDKTELVEAAERRQVGDREGSVRHVEVFLDGCVRTSILGRPQPLPGHRRAARSSHRLAAGYTLNWEEPVVVVYRERDLVIVPVPRPDHRRDELAVRVAFAKLLVAVSVPQVLVQRRDPPRALHKRPIRRHRV